MLTQRRKSFLGISLIILLVIFFHYIGWITPVENFLRNLVNRSSGPIYDYLVIEKSQTENKFNSVDELARAYNELEMKSKETEAGLVRLKLLEDENMELRKRLNFLSTSTYSYVSADVVGRNIELPGSTLVINRGSLAGIEEGNPVIVGGGIMIGKITRVENNTSIVRLINDSQSKVGATVANRDYSIGIVEGGYGLAVQMSFIPQNEIINIGDNVVTSGLESGIPRGLVIGVIETVQKEIYQPFQSAVLTPLFKLDSISNLSVIIKKKENI